MDSIKLNAKLEELTIRSVMLREESAAARRKHKKLQARIIKKQNPEARHKPNGAKPGKKG